jgi:hypothetical protein
VERDGSVLTLPVVQGPSPVPPPTLPPPRAQAGPAGAEPPGRGVQAGPAAGAPRPGGGEGDGPPVVWRVVRDVLGRTTEAAIDHGGAPCWTAARW